MHSRGLPWGSCTLVNPRRGLSLCESNWKRGAPPCFLENKETIPYSLSQGWSLTQGGILTRRQRVITKQRPQKMMKAPNSQGLKIIATQVSAKLTGYEHAGAAFSPPCDPQVHTQPNRKKGRGPNPVHPNKHVRSNVLSGSML